MTRYNQDASLSEMKVTKRRNFTLKTVAEYLKIPLHVSFFLSVLISALFLGYGNVEAQRRPEIVRFAADALSFAGTDGKTAVEIYYMLPLNMVYWERENLRLSGEIKHTVKIYGDKRPPIAEKSDSQKLRFYMYQYSNILNDAYTLSQKFDLEPGEYTVEIELFDEKSGNRGQIRDRLYVEDFADNELHMSDLLLAYNITMDDPKEIFSRETVNMYHHPAHLYLVNKPIYVYFEIDNLFVNGDTDMNNYTLEYAVYVIKKGKVKAGEVPLGRLIENTPKANRDNIKKAKEEMRVSSENNQYGTSDYQFIRIDHHLHEQGEYLLTVRVTDNIRQVSVEKTTPITIFAKN